MRNFKLGGGKEFRVVFGLVLFCSVLSCLVWRKEKKRVWSKDTFDIDSDRAVQGSGRRMVRVVAVQIILFLSHTVRIRCIFCNILAFLVYFSY